MKAVTFVLSHATTSHCGSAFTFVLSHAIAFSTAQYSSMQQRVAKMSKIDVHRLSERQNMTYIYTSADSVANDPLTRP